MRRVLAQSVVPCIDINRIVDRSPERPFLWRATIGHFAKLSVAWSLQHSDPLRLRNVLLGEWCAFRIALLRGARGHPSPCGRAFP